MEVVYIIRSETSNPTIHASKMHACALADIRRNWTTKRIEAILIAKIVGRVLNAILFQNEHLHNCFEKENLKFNFKMR